MVNTKTITFIVAIFMIIQLAQAVEIGLPVDENGEQLKVSLATPKIVFRDNNVSETVSYYIGVKNRNDYPVEITVTPPEDLNIEFDGSTSFTLQPSEEKNLNYDIIITETGNYTKIIGVNYAGNGKSFGLQQSVQFSNIQEGTTQKGGKSWTWIIIVISVLVIAVIFLLFVKGKKRRPVEDFREPFQNRNVPPPQHSEYPKFDLRRGSPSY